MQRLRQHSVFFFVCVAGFAALAAATLHSTPAYATSAGCTAINGGSLNRSVTAGNNLGGNVAGALERGDKLTFTITGAPTNVQFDLQPSNTTIVTGGGTRTVTVTIAEDGVTGVAFFIQAAGGTGTSVTVTCMPASTGTGTGTSDTPSAETAEQVSDAIANAQDAIDGFRIPTAPDALPGFETYNPDLGTGIARRDALLEDQQDLIRLVDDLHRLRDKLIDDAGLNALYPESPATTSVYVGKRSERDEFISGFNRPDETFSPISNQAAGQAYAADYNKAMAAFEAAMANSDKSADFELVREEIANAVEAYEENAAELRTAEDFVQTQSYNQRRYNDGNIPSSGRFFTGGEGANFNVEFSTEMLRQWAQANLDESGTPGGEVPQLTIAGKPVNIWLRGRGTLFDAQNRFGSDGWAGHVLSGIAMKASNRVTVGAFGSYLMSKTESDFNNSDIESTQAGGGAYLQVNVVDSIVTGLSVSHERGEQDIRIGAISGSADTSLTSLSTSVAGSWFVEDVVLAPSVAVSYADFTRKAYTDSSGRVIPSNRTGNVTVSAATTASQTFAFDDGWIKSATPRASATLNYFARENRSFQVSATEIIDLEEWGGNVAGGVTLLTEGGSTVSVDLGLIGIGQDTLGYTGQLQVAFGF